MEEEEEGEGEESYSHTSTTPKLNSCSGGGVQEQQQRSSSPVILFSHLSSTPRSRQPSSPGTSDRSNNHNYSNSSFIHTKQRYRQESPSSSLRRWGTLFGKRKRRDGARAVVTWTAVVVLILFVVINLWVFHRLRDNSLDAFTLRRKHSVSSSSSITTDLIGTTKLQSSLHDMPLKRVWKKSQKKARLNTFLYTRLLALAAHALAEGDSKPEPADQWNEPKDAASSWFPCADKRIASAAYEKSNGYIIITANGGINQQRVAVCNAVAITRLLNATLVIPNFQYNTVWKDRSQFGDIYEEEYFVNYLKADIKIVKELPLELQSLNLEAIGSLVTDSVVMKEAKPGFYLKQILPILLKNRVVHFVGFGNRLASDPVSFELQKLRCRCNFHALQFVTKIQKVGALLVQRMRKHVLNSRQLEQNLLGQFPSSLYSKGGNHIKASRYLAVHLRFEIDMAAYSLCYFGGGKEEEEELEAYRAIHFPALVQLKNSTKMPSAPDLRSEGQCPLTPEEAILMIAALGFKRKTKIYIAGAHVYGGHKRMAALHSLYPNIVTKEMLLSSEEIEPFMNYTSQLAALDFIACTMADAFAMTDSGSQFSALVSGFRMYYGGGNLPTIRPNKRRLASIFVKNSTIEWREFEKRVRKAVRQNKRVIERPTARSIYRHPRCRECMCRIEQKE